MKNKNRCPWCLGVKDPLQAAKVLAYHDTRWCKVEHREQELFAMLILEGMQAGLSWNLILAREENYRRAFADFAPEVVAAFSETKVEELLLDRGIIRNRSKIKGAISNAKAFLQVQKEFGSFDKYIWSFSNNEIIDHHLTSNDELPAQNALSQQISKDLKKRGFKYVGPVIIYSYLQSIGMINDHLETCDFR